jgi:hypothetical protein
MLQYSINSFSLSIDGLTINYTKGERTINAFFDPFATCDLLLSLNVIEDFDVDRNGEPVVLFVTNNCGVPKTGFALWYLFQKHFNLVKRQIEIIVEHIESMKQARAMNAIINHLLQPLQAA